MSASPTSRNRVRFAPFALLLFHVVMTALVPALDALIERGQQENVVHIEPDDRSCPTSHDHLKCQLCRHISTTILAVAGVVRLPHAPSVRPIEVRTTPYLLASSEQVLPVGSRAPPTA